MKKMAILVLLTMSVGLAGCASTGNEEDTMDQGKTNGLVTMKINKKMAADDKAKLEQLVANSAIHQATSWKGAESGTMFTFTSLNIYVNNRGAPCREYQLKAGRQTMQATACRDADAQWQIVKEATG